jgi:hypothetical protein
LRLLVDIVVTRPLELAVQPVDGVVVGSPAKDTVALGVGVSEILQLLRTREEVVERDQVLQSFLFH